MHIFLSAGEPSGDLHGANLASALRDRLPGAELVGFGGDRMAAAGVRLLYPLTELAVMWFGRAVANLHKFLHLGAKAESYFRTRRPDAVVLIDYPGFHWHVAQRAHRYGVPVYYFVPPQLWAWAGWRVKRVRKHFRAVLTAMPFEDQWYRDRGVRTHYVGHPYFDEIAGQNLDPAFLAEQRARAGEIVGILPGSRTQEVTSNGPMLVGAAKKLAARRPGVRFLVAAYKEKQAALVRDMLAGGGLDAAVCVGRTPEVIELSTVCAAVSGSVGLELLSRLKPTVVVYKVGEVMHRVARRLATCAHISLVNLLAGETIYPEYPTSKDVSGAVADHLFRWLNEPSERENLVARLAALRGRVAVPGAIGRAADFLMKELSRAGPVAAGKLEDTRSTAVG
jgi:lipid-A-disaccharide synthase